MLTAGRKSELNQILKGLGLRVNNYEGVHSALTHPSYIFEKGDGVGNHNQRLEFLGDAVIGLIVGDYVYKNFPKKTEGELTKMRAAVVCEGTLAKAAERLGLGQYILMGKGERNCGGASRASNLADAWEALFGALYLELGIEPIKPIALEYIRPELERVIKGHYGDYKTQLQEVVQRNPNRLIEYKIIGENGPDHNKDFIAGIYVNGELQAEGSGRTKKEAEQRAAQQALIHMGELDE